MTNFIQHTYAVILIFVGLPFVYPVVLPLIRKNIINDTFFSMGLAYLIIFVFSFIMAKMINFLHHKFPE